MVGRFDDVKQGDLNGQEGVHVPDSPREPTGKKRPPFRSQSVHSSDEAE
jgi:hypothetical protein